jgi:hypothetical protein
MIFRIDLKGDVTGVFETLKLFYQGECIATWGLDETKPCQPRNYNVR